MAGNIKSEKLEHGREPEFRNLETGLKFKNQRKQVSHRPKNYIAQFLPIKISGRFKNSFFKLHLF